MSHTYWIRKLVPVLRFALSLLRQNIVKFTRRYTFYCYSHTVDVDFFCFLFLHGRAERGRIFSRTDRPTHSKSEHRFLFRGRFNRRGRLSVRNRESRYRTAKYLAVPSTHRVTDYRYGIQIPPHGCRYNGWTVRYECCATILENEQHEDCT